MQTLQSYIRRSDAFRAFAADRKSNIKAEGLDGFPLFQCAHLMADSVKGNTWIVCPTEEMARTIYGDNGMVRGLPVTLLPTSGRVLYSPWEGSSKEYEQISRELVSVLRERPLTVYGAAEVCHGHDEEEVVEAIRWMIDNGVLEINGDTLSVKNT